MVPTAISQNCQCLRATATSSDDVSQDYGEKSFSCDRSHQSRFLWKVLAKFVVMEVCDAGPPPLRFNHHDDERLVWPPRAPWGCSLSYQAERAHQR